MGLSIAISGAIVMLTIIFVLFAIPNVVNNIFSIGDASLKASLLGDTISQTEISMEDLDVKVNSPNVNFTVINEGQEKLWDFDKFNVIITYDEASGRPTEELSFDGLCQGVVPAAGNWCIETISEDIMDPDVLNGGESARIWTRVNQDLTTGNTIVSFNTDNGATATLPVTSRSIVATGVDPPVACESGFYGRTFHDTDSGLNYICDSTRDKWLSIETIALWGEERENCGAGEDLSVQHRCSADFGDNMGPGRDILTGAGLYIPYDATIIAYGFSKDADTTCDPGDSFDVELWGSGTNTDDTQAFITTLGTILNDEDTDNNNSLDIDIDEQYISLGIDNNNGCGDIDEWNTIIYMKWRHADP